MQTDASWSRRGMGSKQRDKNVKTATSGVVLWRPDIVLATVAGGTQRPKVRLAEPTLRPESMRARVETAQTILGSIADAREHLTMAHARGAVAQTERQRVSATIDAYRAEAALDEVLT
ncbi:MAG: hypothetical protein HY719_01060, partial [Planctomycetes bacterium]|nr:hypothetical protein [Planctomycetota bacterium]